MSEVIIEPVKEHYGMDYYVYQGSKLVRVCPSKGMAVEVAAGLSESDDQPYRLDDF